MPKENNTYSQYDHIKSILFEVLIEDGNFDDLLNVSAELIGNPIIVIDSCYRVIGYSEIEDIYDTIWLENIRLGFCSYDFITQVNMLKSVKEGKHFDYPYEVTCEESIYKKLVCKMKTNNIDIGNVIIIACKKEIKPEDYQILSIISKVLSMKINARTYIGASKSKNIIRQDFLYDLLNNRIHSKEEMQNRMKIADFNLPANMCLLVFDLEGYIHNNDITLSLKENLSRLKEEFEYSLYLDHFIVLIYAEEKMKDFINKISDFLDNNNIYLGVSRCFADISLCYKYYRQALTTINLGKRIFAMKHIINYYEVLNYTFLNFLEKDCDIYDYVHPALQRLKEYDRLHNSDLYDVLYIYILNGSSIQKTAEEFYMHRNTVRYKINKIKELIQIDFSDIIQVSNLLNSYSINKYYEYERENRNSSLDAI